MLIKEKDQINNLSIEYLIKCTTFNTLSTIIKDLSSSSLIKIIKPNNNLYKKYLPFIKSNVVNKNQNFVSSLANDAISQYILKEIILWSWFKDNNIFYLQIIGFIETCLINANQDNIKSYIGNFQNFLQSQPLDKYILQKLNIFVNLLQDFINYCKSYIMVENNQQINPINNNNKDNLLLQQIQQNIISSTNNIYVDFLNVEFVISQINLMIANFSSKIHLENTNKDSSSFCNNNNNTVITQENQLEEKVTSIPTLEDDSKPENNMQSLENNSNEKLSQKIPSQISISYNKVCGENIKEIEKNATEIAISDNSQMLSKYHQLQQENKELKQRIKELEKERNTINSKLTEIQKELVTLTNNLNDLQMLNTRLQRENLQLSKQIEKLNELHNNDNYNQCLNNKNFETCIKSQSNSSICDKDNKNEQITNLIAKISELQLEVRNLQNIVKSKNRKIDDLTSQIEVLQREKKKFIDKSHIIIELQNKIEELAKQIKMYQNASIGKVIGYVKNCYFSSINRVLNAYIVEQCDNNFLCIPENKFFPKKPIENEFVLICCSDSDIIDNNSKHFYQVDIKNFNNDTFSEINITEDLSFDRQSISNYSCELDPSKIKFVWVIETSRRKEILGTLIQKDNIYFVQPLNNDLDIVPVRIVTNTNLLSQNDSSDQNNNKDLLNQPVVGVYLPSFETRQPGVYKIKFLQTDSLKSNNLLGQNTNFTTFVNIEKYYNIISFPQNKTLFQHILKSNKVNFTFKDNGILFETDYKKILAIIKPKLSIIPICRNEECFEQCKKSYESYISSNSIIDEINNTSKIIFYRYAKADEICSICGKKIDVQDDILESKIKENLEQEITQISGKKILILGGDTIGRRYVDILSKYNLYVEWYSGFKSISNLKQSSFSYDLLIVITSQLSHTTLRELHSFLGKTSIPIIFMRWCGINLVLKEIINFFKSRKK